MAHQHESLAEQLAEQVRQAAAEGNPRQNKL